MSLERFQRAYQKNLNPKFRKITNFCSTLGCLLGIGCWYALLIAILDRYGLENQQFEWSLITIITVIIALVLFILFTFLGAFLLHLPFVALKIITLSEAFRAVFLFGHPKRWIQN
jgi:hypothetical protein